jgi:hypothetical protein
MTFTEYLRNKVLDFISESRAPAVNQPRLGGLVPVDAENHVKSNFEADAPKMRAFANSSPENLAQVLIFVLSTPITNLKIVYESLPIIMAIFKTKFADRDDVSRDEFEAQVMKNIESGVTIRPAAFGFKLDGIVNAWNRRNEIYQRMQQFAQPGNEDVVAMLNYLAQFPGLDVVKAAFAVQCVLGKLGCIDVHNHLIYTQYMKSLGLSKGETTKRVNMLNLKNFATSGKNESGRIEAIKRYLKVLGMLEKEGFGTRQLWDVWTTFVGNVSMTKKGQSMYNTELGTGVDPDNLTKMSGLKIHRSGRDIPMTPSPAGRGVGMAHDIPGRQPEDLIGPGMQIADSPKPGHTASKFPSFQAISPRLINQAPVDKLLIWVARDPDMANRLGLSGDQLRDLHRIMKARGIRF